jgi:hypothetical protein
MPTSPNSPSKNSLGAFQNIPENQSLDSLDEYKKFLEFTPPKLVPIGAEIPFEYIKFFSKYETRKVQELFEKYKREQIKSENMYIVHFFCPDCEKEYVEKSTKSHFFDYLRFFKKYAEDKNYQLEPDFLCRTCGEKEKLKRKKIEENETKETNIWYARTIEENTKDLINTYLNPNYSWSKEAKQSSWFWEVKNKTNFADTEEIAHFIQTMSYKDFLKTPYWKAIAVKVRQNAGYSCQMSKSHKTQLQVHHRSYEHHGYEHLHLEDLVCICKNCHQTHHEQEVYV